MSKKEVTTKSNILNARDKVYCGVEYSVCNKDLTFFNHSLCCLKCKHNCNGCTVKNVNQCDRVCSKEDIILHRIEELTKEKDKHIQALKNIYKEINNLYKELV